MVFNLHFSHRFFISFAYQIIISYTGENVYIWFGNSFIQILSETTFKNIEDSEFCQKSSYVFSSITKFLLNIFQVSYLISEAKTFELFSGLLFSHRSNEEICGNTLYALDRILYTLFRMESFGWDLKQAFETCLFDVLISIMEKTKNERTAFLCMSIFDTIRDKGKIHIAFSFLIIHLFFAQHIGLKMVPDPYKDDFIQLSRKATETYNKRIEPLSSDECISKFNSHHLKHSFLLLFDSTFIRRTEAAQKSRSII